MMQLAAAFLDDDTVKEPLRKDINYSGMEVWVIQSIHLIIIFKTKILQKTS